MMRSPLTLALVPLVMGGSGAASDQCEHFLLEQSGGDSHGRIDICGAPGIGFMRARGQHAMPSTAALLRADNLVLARLTHYGFVPLELTMRSDNDDTSSREATSVDRGHVDPSLFKPPVGYTSMTMLGRPAGTPQP